MRIVQLVSNLHPTTPLSNNAIYSHVGSLSEGLLAKGHEVHLFGSTDSDTKAELHAITAALYKEGLPDDVLRHYLLEHISRGYAYARTSADIVHTHLSLFSSFFSRLIDVPTLVSVHSPIRDAVRPLMEYHKNLRYISFSLAQRKQFPELNWYANIYHGVDTSLFSFNPEPEEYLLFLGRITEDKGVHHAIEAAKTAGVPLLIAGRSYPMEGYWQKEVEPHINVDTVRYIGEVGLEAKIPLLQKAKAVLFPTTIEEAFGYVMVEAMSCGTPVIGFNKGSIPEIIKDGESGFVVEDCAGMTEAIRHLDGLDRTNVRKRAELYFSVEKMVEGYERVYERVLEEVEFQKTKRERKAGGATS